MSSGQQRAVRELNRLRAAAPDDFDFDAPKELSGDLLRVDVSWRIGLLERHADGLPLKEREAFTLFIDKDYPFVDPWLCVWHNRWAGRDHVTWNHSLCLYQSDLGWNPADGLYGFFNRLAKWLGQAARNDMDPVEGPLEPPHHITDHSQMSFMITADAPAAAGELWIGYAKLERRANYIEVIGWSKDVEAVPKPENRAFTVILKERLPMEFPETGENFIAELVKQGLDRSILMHAFGIAADQGKEDEPVYLILGTPARRGPDGSSRHHFAIWAAKYRGSFKVLAPADGDEESVARAKEKVAEEFATDMLDANLSWCPIYENRAEINVRRDRDRPLAQFRGKNVLLLGCGALGSWAGEMIVRAGAAKLDMLDNRSVKPGLLVRQNYRPEDIGKNKAQALAAHLDPISATTVRAVGREAHAYLMADLEVTTAYDLIVDCTASPTLQMKLERDWRSLQGRLPRYVAMMVDNRSENGIAVDVPRGSAHGPWVASLLLKQAVCADRRAASLAEAFYTDRALAGLFQPEPGCSDPTFAGSSADSMSMVAQFLNVVGAQGAAGIASGHLFPNPAGRGPLCEHRAVLLPILKRLDTDQGQILVAPRVFDEVRHFIADNARKRSRRHETGGLLWGFWDDAAEIVLMTDASGPPPDSKHKAAHFLCGTQGTRAEHDRRYLDSRSAEGFVGMWHTHPGMTPDQSVVDHAGMSILVAGIGQNQRRALMAIFGERNGQDELGAYIYESTETAPDSDLVGFKGAHLPLTDPVFENAKTKRCWR